MYSGTAFVRRKGFELVGLSELNDGEVDIPQTFAIRGESLLEHQAKTAWLASVFVSNFPRFFGDRRLASSAALPNFWHLITTALCHDVGELKIGDIPDDGNPLHGTKDAEERKVFNELIQVYEVDDRVTLRQAFREFQDKTTFAGQGLYALDKFEAVATLLNMERHKAYGSILHKASPTESDCYYMTQTGAASATDCWAAHMCSVIRDFPKIIRDPIMTLLDIAVRDVRGGPFEWFGKDILPWQ